MSFFIPEFHFCYGQKVNDMHLILTKVAIFTVPRCSDKDSSVVLLIILLVLTKATIPFITFKIRLHKCFLFDFVYKHYSFPGGSDGKESAYNVGDLDLIPGFPWRRKCLPTLVFLPGEFHIQKSQVGYSSQGQKESDMTETNTFTFHEHFKALQVTYFPASSFQAVPDE